MSWHEIWQMSLRKVGVFDVCMCFISTISYKSFIWNCAPCSNFWLVYEYLLRNCAFLCTLSSRLIKQLRGNKYIAVPVRYNWKSWFIAPCIMKRMDDSSYRRNFDPDKKNEVHYTSITIAGKSILKWVKSHSLVAKYVAKWGI